MKYALCLSLTCILACPQVLLAAEQTGQTGHKYTPKEQIVFSQDDMVAFDRSGKYATTRTLADGSTITEYNGSMMNVTVARMGPDGKVETYCTSSAEAARTWMAGEFDTRPASPDIPVMEK